MTLEHVPTEDLVNEILGRVDLGVIVLQTRDVEGEEQAPEIHGRGLRYALIGLTLSAAHTLTCVAD